MESPPETAAHTFKAVVQWFEKGRISMKKVFVFLLAMMLLTSVACAWAEGTTEELPEINFRDVAFGYTRDEVQSLLDIKHSNLNPVFKNAYDSTPFRMEDVLLNGQWCNDYNPLAEQVIQFGDLFIALALNGITEVAGYPLYTGSLLFVRPVVDGKLIEADGESLFYAAFYEFINCDDAMEADLNTKLSGIYGTPENITDEQGNNLIVWYGANDTEVTLFRDGSTIRLVYAWRGAETLIDEALAVAEANLPPAKDVSKDSSGL